MKKNYYTPEVELVRLCTSATMSATSPPVMSQSDLGPGLDPDSYDEDTEGVWGN